MPCAPHAVYLQQLCFLPELTALMPQPSCRRREIQAEFFNGQPFTSSTLSNTKFTMVFKADGKVTRRPQGTTGVGGEGTWKLSKDGFCTTWKSSKENCFTLVTAGEKKWSVMKGKASVGTWSK
jgi:hypothetical protein